MWFQARTSQNRWVGTVAAPLADVSSLRFVALGLFSSLLLPSAASAASVECSDDGGTCSVRNGDSGDSVTCGCFGSDGEVEGSTGGTGGHDWDGLDEAALLEICHEELAFCQAGPPPEGGVHCSNEFGSCVVNNDPFDSTSCSCDGDGSGGTGTSGGNVWGGLSERELETVCLQQVDSVCSGFADTDSDVTSSTVTGWADSSTGGDDTGGRPDTDGAGEATTGASSAGDSGTSSTGGTTTGGDTSGAVSDSGAADEGGGVDAGASEAGSEESGQAAADDDGSDPVRGACQVVAPERAGTGWMFAGLLLAGLWGRRRRMSA